MIYKLFHKLLVFCFKKISFLNQFIPTLPRGEVDSISLSINEIKEVVSYNTIYKQKNIHPEINFSIGDNQIFRNSKEMLPVGEGNLPTIEYQEVFSSEFKNVIVCKNSGFIISQQSKKLFIESSVWKRTWLKDYLFYESLKRYAVEKIKEKASFLYSPANYYHWFAEFLARLILLTDNHREEIIIYINEPLNEWQVQALNFFYVDVSKIRVLPQNISFVSFEKFYFISFLGILIVHTEAIKKINSYIQNNLKRTYFKADYAYKKIYISRQKAAHRKVVNEEELVNLLTTKYNYHVVYAEDYSVAEQFKMFSEAEYIIAVHGPSLTNLIASNKCNVIELFNENHIVNCYALLAFSIGNINYTALKCKSIGNASSVLNDRPFYGYNDIDIDINRLDGVLKQIHCIEA